MVRSNKARIIGLGSYAPKRVLSNHDLEQMVETSDEWIRSRTGIRERRIAAEGEYSSDMGLYAAKKALVDANLGVEKVDCLLFATITPDYLCPSNSCLLQHQLEASQVAAMDLHAACSGFLYALSVAKAYVESGIYQHVLVVASEKLSSIVDYGDRNTCILFGDGAAATVVSNQGVGYFIDHATLDSKGDGAELLKIPSGGARSPASVETVESRGHYLKMHGGEIFKHAVLGMEESIIKCLGEVGLSAESVDWFIPHQANARIIRALAERFHFPREKVSMTIDRYGNTSAASIGISLEELHRTGKVKEGDRLILSSFGAGLTIGTVLLTCQMDRDV